MQTLIPSVSNEYAIAPRSFIDNRGNKRTASDEDGNTLYDVVRIVGPNGKNMIMVEHPLGGGLQTVPIGAITVLKKGDPRLRISTNEPKRMPRKFD